MQDGPNVTSENRTRRFTRTLSSERRARACGACNASPLDSPLLPSPFVEGVSGGGSALQNQVFCPPLSLCPLPSSTPPRPLRRRRRSSLLARKPEIGWMHYARFDSARARFYPHLDPDYSFQPLPSRSRAPTHHPAWPAPN